MWTRRIVTILLALIAGHWDSTIATWLPGGFEAVQISLPLVLVLAVYSTEERAVTAALVSGVVQDVLLPSNSGLVSFRYVIIALLLHALSQNVLTNRSLIGAYAMGSVAVLLDRLLLWGVEGLFRLGGRMVVEEPHTFIFAELLWMTIVMTAVFMGFAAFTRRFLPPISRPEVGRIPLWRT